MRSPINQNQNAMYRAEIDGLRAIAVIAVIINHFHSEFLPSGFLGVDIFFVISGFVVTASLATKTNLTWGEYLKGFYSRRMKRLVPALVVCVALTVLLGSLFIAYPGESLYTGLASLVGVSNIYLFKQSSNYFGQASELNLFTQTWSLGVEEQFYFIFPLLLSLTGFSRQKKPAGERNLALWLIFLGLISLFAFCLLHAANHSAAFYLMPMRFWELAMGALCYILCSKTHLSTSGKSLLSLACFFILIAILLLPSSFQLTTTIGIVLITSGLLWLTKYESWVKRFLSRRGMVKVGVLSYSIYLWHWPVLVIARYTIGINFFTIPFLLLILIAFSLFSYYLVEKPWRNKQYSDFKIIAISLAASFMCIGLILLVGKPLKGKLFTGKIIPPIVETFKGSTGSANCRWDYKSNINHYDLLMKNCVLNKNTSDSSKTLFITGDSHAEALGNLAQIVSNQLNIKINLKVAGSCLFPVSFIYTTEGVGLDKIKECQRFQELRLQEILNTAKPGDIVLNVNYYSYYLTSPSFNDPKVMVNRFDQNLKPLSADEAQLKYTDDLLRATEDLKSRGIKFIVLAPQLQFKKNLKDCTVQWFNLVEPGEIENCAFDKDELLTHRKNMINHFQAVATKSGLIVWDPIDQLCPSAKCTYYNRENKGYFADRDHYSGDGARFLSQSFISLLRERGLVSIFPADKLKP